MPRSLPERCESIQTPVSERSGFKVLHITPPPLLPSFFLMQASTLIVFNSPSFFFIPRLSLPSDFPSFLFFLRLCLSSFTFHLFFPLKRSSPRMVVVVRRVLWLCPRHNQHYTHRHFPDAQRRVRASIETNGEVTLAAVLNNGLHSHLSGSTVRKWGSGSGCWDQQGCQRLLEDSKREGEWDAEPSHLNAGRLKNQTLFPFLRSF